MQIEESIKDMCMCFIQTINNLKSLLKTYTSEEMLRKVSCCLLRSKWDPSHDHWRSSRSKSPQVRWSCCKTSNPWNSL